MKDVICSGFIMSQVLQLEASYSKKQPPVLFLAQDLPDTVTCYKKKISIIGYVHLEKQKVISIRPHPS
jgi:hypothetical protein